MKDMVISTLLLIILLASPSLTYTGADVARRPANSWIAFPATQLLRVTPPGDTYPNIYAVEGPTCIVSCWCGGAYDSQRNRLIIWGGGHNGYFGNELYAFSVDSLKWTRLTNPTPNPALCADNNSDGTPNSRHTYSSICYIAHADKFFSIGGAWACPGGGCGMNKTWTFDFATNRWRNMNPSGDLPHSWCEDNCAYDPNSKKVFYFDGFGGFYSYDYDANRWTQLGTENRYNYTCVVDPKRKLLFNIGHGNVYVYDIGNSNYTAQQWTTTGGSTLINKGAIGLAYDSYSDKIVGWHGGDIYELNPDTRVWTPHTAVNTPAPDGNGTFGRWQYAPNVNAFVNVNRTGDNVYFYKMTAYNPQSVENRTRITRPGLYLEVHPNPARTTVSIGMTFSGNPQGTDFTLLDVQGNLISQTNSPDGGWKIKTSELRNAVYLLRAKSGGQTLYRKILVQK